MKPLRDSLVYELAPAEVERLVELIQGAPASATLATWLERAEGGCLKVDGELRIVTGSDA